MNKTFAEHVTQTAFFLSISKKQIEYLLILESYPYPNEGYYKRRESKPDNWIASFGALERKGLAVRIIDNEALRIGHWELTVAGGFVCELLHEAGFSRLDADERKAA